VGGHHGSLRAHHRQFARPCSGTTIAALPPLCQSSRTRCSLLCRHGYKNAYLVDGGIAAWEEKGYPLFSNRFCEIKVIKYSEEHEEEYEVRPH